MKASGHALYKGDLYGIPPGSRYTSVYMMDIEIYLHKMMANDNLREDLVKHGDRIANLLKHPACELIKQTEFDFDLIEIMLPFVLVLEYRRENSFTNQSLMMTSGKCHLECMCRVTVAHLQTLNTSENPF